MPSAVLLAVEADEHYLVASALEIGVVASHIIRMSNTDQSSGCVWTSAVASRVAASGLSATIFASAFAAGVLGDRPIYPCPAPPIIGYDIVDDGFCDDRRLTTASSAAMMMIDALKPKQL